MPGILAIKLSKRVQNPWRLVQLAARRRPGYQPERPEAWPIPVRSERVVGLGQAEAVRPIEDEPILHDHRIWYLQHTVTETAAAPALTTAVLALTGPARSQLKRGWSSCATDSRQPPATRQSGSGSSTTASEERELSPAQGQAEVAVEEIDIATSRVDSSFVDHTPLPASALKTPPRGATAELPRRWPQWRRSERRLLAEHSLQNIER
eukprot:scaffold276436_cov33-Tisochrysis_lutea.AAC.1